MNEDRQSEAYKALLHSDARCGSRWGGANTSHCAACHLTFSAVGTFDDHRVRGACHDPATLGMVLSAGRVYEAWGYPAPEELPIAWR